MQYRIRFDELLNLIIRCCFLDEKLKVLQFKPYNTSANSKLNGSGTHLCAKQTAYKDSAHQPKHRI